MRSRRGCHSRLVAGGGQKERHREYGPGADAPFYSSFCGCVDSILGDSGMDRPRIDIKRNALIAFDLLLVVVLGLLLYSLSARDPESPPGLADILQVVLLVSALLADVVALGAIVARISEFGISPNRIAALGENVVLLINLVWSTVLYIRFVREAVPFSALERWQTDYLPVYAVWAAIVVTVFPPVFGYI